MENLNYFYSPLEQFELFPLFYISCDIRNVLSLPFSLVGRSFFFFSNSDIAFYLGLGELFFIYLCVFTNKIFFSI